MVRILKRSLAALLLLVLVAAGFAFAVLRSSLPVLDGELVTKGIQARVSIERDGRGIPTITAATRPDLAFGTGFAHGQDRFFQMDLTRRKAAGELAALFGPIALPLDRKSRLHRFRARATAAIARMSDMEQAVMGAYVAGVNAGLESLTARPFEYFVLRAEPVAWTPEDTLLVVYAMYMQLNDERASRDVQRGFAASVLPADVFNWMYPRGTSWDAALTGDVTAVSGIPGPDSIDLRETRTVFDDRTVVDSEGLLPGSNNWVVGGALTASGRAIVANDMHLGITTPNVFYRARLTQTGDDARDVIGVTLPGTPVVVAGSNGKVAWGFTNSYGDWTDAVVLRPGATEDSYKTPEGDKPIVEIRERIDVRSQASEDLLVRETHWGPILDDVDYPDGDIAVSWIAHDPQGVNIVQLDLETTATVADALRIANRVAIPPQNFVVGDTSGNIGWTIAGRIPRRGTAESLQPADWSNGVGWHGWLAADEYPRIMNPDNARIWTANTRVVSGVDLQKIGDGGYDLGARGGQIRDNLFAAERFEPGDMLAIQLDDRALFLERWRALLLDLLTDEITADDAGRAEYRRLVQSWVPRASTDSVGYRLVKAFRTDVRRRSFQMLMTPVRAMYGDDVLLRISNQFERPLWQLVNERPAHLLSADYDHWTSFLLESVDSNLRYYEENYAGPLADRNWGEVNTAAIRHPLSRALPFLSGWLDMPAEPLHGDGNMPRVQSPSFGASERFAVSPGDEASSYLHMPAGQSGHPMSDYYRSGHDDWAAGRPTPFLPGAPQNTLSLIPHN